MITNETAVGVATPHGVERKNNGQHDKVTTGSSNALLPTGVLDETFLAADAQREFEDEYYLGAIEGLEQGLTPEQITDWVRRQYLKDGDPSRWFSQVNPVVQRGIRRALVEAEQLGLSDHSARSKFQLATAEEVSVRTATESLIKGVLPRVGIASVYGPPSVGKSFLANDMLYAIAAGEQWQGFKTKQAPVVIVCLEGEGGLATRVNAHQAKHGPISPQVLFLTGGFSFMNEADTAGLADAIKAAGAINGAILIDTLNRAAPGIDENSSEGMGRVIEGAKRLQALVGGLVILVHHSGKDASKGLRGHSSLHAALDAAIEVSRNGDERIWRITKSKDGLDSIERQFRLEVVEVGIDEDGDSINSCVVVPSKSAFESVAFARVPKGGNQRIVYNRLNDLLRDSIELGRGGAPEASPCIALEVAVVGCRDSLSTDPKRRTERVRQAITGLVTAQLYKLQEGWLWRA